MIDVATSYTCLSHDHKLVRHNFINKKELVSHLILDHGVHATNEETKGALGKRHLNIHFYMANPQVARSFGIRMEGPVMMSKEMK